MGGQGCSSSWHGREAEGRKDKRVLGGLGGLGTAEGQKNGVWVPQGDGLTVMEDGFHNMSWDE